MTTLKNEQTGLLSNNLYGTCMIMLKVCTKVSQTAISVEAYEILKAKTTRK